MCIAETRLASHDLRASLCFDDVSYAERRSSVPREIATTSPRWAWPASGWPANTGRCWTASRLRWPSSLYRSCRLSAPVIRHFRSFMTSTGDRGESFSQRRLHRDGPAGLPVRLREGAGDQLVRLAPLIRPLVELHWTRMVAAINNVATEERDLHRHLFGRDRLTPPKALREGLADPQASRCFYCRRPFRRAPEADHFIPRVRCGIDAVENLVLADSACNNDKRDRLPDPALVEVWADRNLEHEDTLAQLASACGWDSDAAGTLAVARSIYRHLPPGPAAFWHGAGRVDITHVRPGIVIETA